MQQDLRLPRDEVVSLALSLEQALQDEVEGWYSGDQVMDLHHLKTRLKEKEDGLDRALGRVRLQGTALVLTRPQKEDLRSSVLEVVATCMYILQVTQLLEPDTGAERSGL